MRRRSLFLAVLMTTLCLLCACAGGANNDPLQAAMDFRATLLSQGGCAFELEALAEAGDRLWELTLACELDPAGRGTVTVLAPESIAGITAVTDGETGSLRYEDLALGLGTVPGTELAPAAAPGRLARAWGRAWIASAGADGEALLVCYEDGDLLVETWFDETGTPLRADPALDGQVRVAATVRNFEWKAVETDETTEEDLG